ncbi:MAG: hypothetical protein RLZ07_1056 [Pseudomonadota bacterium]|jgi:hypothetical protein
MTAFDAREQAFEAKFAHDEALRFRVHARRDKLLGIWAGERLGKSGVSLHNYAMDLVARALGREGEVALKNKIEDDFAQAGLPLAEGELAQKMTMFLTEAMKQLAQAD